ncbi:hypothetical protein GDO86_011242 [Hymenochirus boettgeri]|uniref:U3 small nucleolar RNA-associated protein NOL7 C-terminal domain-containing protein n=1 Tax=Hymenochirus boettgeri TaxID=247094 RepID=A0A8T2JGC6_9PIPI|nr:hypothetical protein GDO86_011242 [Hymenochirus boettgeri]
MSPESEDEGPEEVTFQSAKNRAQEIAREQKQAANGEKALLKEKRKRKQELFKEQKAKKLLAEDFLQTLSALPDKRLEEYKDQDPKKGNADFGKKYFKKKLKPKIRLQDNYKVVRSEDYAQSSLQQQKAKEFIQMRLYGKNINRTSAREM